MAVSPRRWWPSSPDSYFDLRPSDELYNAIDWGTILRPFFWGPGADDAGDDALHRQLPEVAPRDEDCAICLQHLACSSSSEEDEEEEEEEEGATPRAMPCSHVFHERSIFQLVRHNRECPLCRKPLPTPQPQWHGYHYRDDDDDDRLQRTMPVPREMLEIEVL
ncbi:hypothetical protein PR202_gb13482 [Eleusine coracana subsp. coracana]|uniref:RING-type domain-containing protein n=1 Tax=Eleusine coracana subsp. coracana TaxID=191504 RepID=A0AAV5EQL5_ELECO|nr:hypothetical protein PR202_gb13482 [Eleusine coracana subsp. coracana]